MSQEITFSQVYRVPTLIPIPDTEYRVIRYSFYIDLYLLKIFIENGIHNFSDHPSIMYYVYKTLKTHGMKTQWHELREILKGNDEVNFLLNPSYVDLKQEDIGSMKFTQILGDFEYLIFKNNLLKNLGIKNMIVYCSKDGQNKVHIKGLRRLLKLNDGISGGVVCGKFDHFEQDEHEENEQMFECISEDEHPEDTIQDIPESKPKVTVTREVIVDKTLDKIVFYDYGVTILKNYFDFSRLRIEELSENDKKLLKNIVFKYLDDRDKKVLGTLLYQILVFKSSNLKEYLRNLELFREYMTRFDHNCVPRTEKLGVVHVMFKVREMINFLNKVFFTQNVKKSLE